MLEVVRGVPIAPRGVPINHATLRKNGQQVANELGKRYLLRYLLPDQVGLYANGSERGHWVTPTPYSPEETISWLALPRPTQPRSFVMLLDSSKIAMIYGPRWCRLGKGIEYLLPQGFSREAIVFPWPIEVT